MRTRRRIHPYVRPELVQRLTAYCAARGITESAAVETAVENYLAGGERDNEVILRRLDRLSRAAGRQQRDLDVLTESLAAVVEMWFSLVPERSDKERAAGQRLGHARYEQFLDVISSRLAGGVRTAAKIARQEPADDAPTQPQNISPTDHAS
jgi:hypothetical protein